ncbi:MAG TPA: hypothetical protein VFU15_07165 [Bacteroidia bacterium]|nr:hypothetical protein [Bacteroidia bacterium]
MASVRAKLIPALLFISFFIFSCETPTHKIDLGDNAKEHAQTKNSSVTVSRTPIGNTGYSIELPSSHMIQAQPGADFQLFYFTPHDTVLHRGEAGMYIGAHPDVNPPKGDVSSKEMTGILLGKQVTWIEYEMEEYTQRETFVDMGNDQYIHVWCYANNLPELENLFKMVNTITY